MDASDCDVHVHNTYIYKYNFHLDIYICVLLGVSSCSSFYLVLVFLKNGGYCGQSWYNTSVHAALRWPTYSGYARRMVGQLQNQVGQLAPIYKALVCKSKHALNVGSRAPSKSSRTSLRMHSQKHGVEQAMYA